MKVFTLILLSLVILVQCKANVEEDFPPINSDGELFIEWDDVSQDQFDANMETFQETYNVTDLKYFQLSIDDTNMTNFASFSILKQYSNLYYFIIDVEGYQSGLDISGLTQYLPDSILKLYFQNDGSFEFANYEQFFKNFQMYPQLQQFALNTGSDITQQTHDAFISYLAQYLPKSIQSIQLFFLGDMNVTSTDAMSQLSRFTSLIDLQLAYPDQNTLGIMIDLRSIFATATEQIPSLRNFSFAYIKGDSAVMYNYNWVGYIQKFVNLNQFGILIAPELDSTDMTYLQYILSNITSLTQLQSLSIDIEVENKKLTCDLNVLQRVQNMTMLKYLWFEFDLPTISHLKFDYLSQLTQLESFTLAIISKTDPLTEPFQIDSKSLKNIYLELLYTQKTNVILNLNTPLIESETLTIYDEDDNTDQTGDSVQVQINWLQNQPNLKTLLIGVHSGYVDAQTLKFEYCPSVTDLEIKRTAIQQQYFSSIDVMKNLTILELKISFENLTFLEDYNSLKHLAIFNDLNVTHSYIYVEPSDINVYIIEACDSECLRCSGPQLNQCVSCLDYYLYNSQCIATCPAGYHPNQVTHECDPDTLNNRQYLRVHPKIIQE